MAKIKGLRKRWLVNTLGILSALGLANAVTEDTLPGKARVNADCESWIDLAERWLRRQFGV